MAIRAARAAAVARAIAEQHRYEAEPPPGQAGGSRRSRTGKEPRAIDRQEVGSAWSTADRLAEVTVTTSIRYRIVAAEIIEQVVPPAGSGLGVFHESL